MSNGLIIRDFISRYEQLYLRMLLPGEKQYFLSVLEAAVEIISLLVLIVMLIRNKGLRKSNGLPEKMFRRLCLATVALALVHLFMYTPVRIEGGYTLVFLFYVDPVGLPVTLLFHLMDMLYLFCCNQWLAFVDVSVNNSKERVKLIYLYSIPVYFITTALLLVLHMFERYHNIYMGLDMAVSVVTGIITFSFSAVNLMYAINDINYFKIDVKQPLFLHAGVFSIPYLTGLLLRRVFHVDAFFMVLAIMFIMRYLKSRHESLQPKTGFYNEHFIREFERFLLGNGWRSGTVIELKSKQNSMALADTISECKPFNSVVFAMDDGSYLVQSCDCGETAAEYFIKLINDMMHEKDPSDRVTSRFWVEEDGEGTEDFFMRITSNRSVRAANDRFIERNNLQKKGLLNGKESGNKT